MAQESGSAKQDASVAGADASVEPQWQRTLWAMVGIQFVMTMAFSMLTPIMPLFLPVLGVETRARSPLGWHPHRHHFLCRRLRLALVGAACRPHGRKLMLLRSSIARRCVCGVDGRGSECMAGFRLSRADGRLCRVLKRGDRAGREPGAGGTAWLCARLASTGQLVGSLVGPLIGGVLADATGSYRIPFYCTAATILVSTGFVWFGVHERFVPPARRAAGAPCSAA